MRILAQFLAILALVSAPAFAFAQLGNEGLPFSFGGEVVSINYCIHGAVNIIIKPAGFFDVSYVWGVPPETISVPPAPPIKIGQQVLGIALPVPVPCIGFGLHPPIWYGWQVIYGGASAPFSPGSKSLFGF
jgi:hypothetical protein